MSIQRPNLPLIERLQRVLWPAWNLRNRFQQISPLAANPSPSQKVLSVVIGSYNRNLLLQKTIQSVRAACASVTYEIIVIEGGSTDGALEWLIQQKDIITIVQHNRGEFLGKPIERRSWGYFMNLGFKSAQGQYILMLSDDCLLLPGAVEAGLARFLTLEKENRKIGGVAFYFRNWPQETDYYVQKTLGGKLMVNHGLFLRAAMANVGFVDEQRYIFYKADGDLCLKLWAAGYEIVDCPEAYVEHYFDDDEPVRQTNNTVMAHDRAAYHDRWRGIFYHAGQSQLGIGPGRLNSPFNDPTDTATKIWGEMTLENSQIESSCP